MMKATLLSVSALLAIAFSFALTSADDAGAQGGPTGSNPSGTLRAALLEAQNRGFLDDHHIDALIRLVDELIAARADDPSPPVQEQGLDSPPPETAAWEGTFALLLSRLEEASRMAIIDSKIENAQATLVIRTIADNTGETAEQVRERLLEKIAAGPMTTSGTRASPVPIYETAMYGDAAITVLSSSIAASTTIGGWGPGDTPPDEGYRFVAVRIRVDGRESPYGLDSEEFGLVASSGRIIRADDPTGACPGSPGHAYVWLDPGGLWEGILCYQVPIGEDGLILFSESASYVGRTLGGFWAMSQQVEAPAAVSEPAAITEGYGSVASPVPAGQSARVPDGLAFTVLSHGDWHVPSRQGHKYITVRLRIEGVSGDYGLYGDVLTVYDWELGLVTTSGRIIDGASHGCPDLPLQPYRVFEGGWVESDRCFEIPTEERAVFFFYRSYRSIGVWQISADGPPPASIETPRGIGDEYGARRSPVPLGEGGRTSGGLAVTVLSAGASPDPDLLRLRLRAEYFGQESGPVDVEGSDFGIVTASGLVLSEEYCDQYSYWLEMSVFRGGWQEGDICFRVPAEEVDPTLFYMPLTSDYFPDGPRASEGVLGFWATTPDPVPPPESQTPRAISADFGTLSGPVPAGETALAPDGVAITAVGALTDARLLGLPGTEATTPVVVRVRLESFDADPFSVREVSAGDFGVAGASGMLDEQETRLECPWGADELDTQLFPGAKRNGSLCFGVPIGEMEGLSIYYWPDGADEPLGFWAVPAGPRATGAPSISRTLGTLRNPVPLGQKAVGPGGVAVTVLATNVNVIMHDRPADEGNRYVTLRVRVENLTGVDGAIEGSFRDFGLVTHPGEVIYVVDFYHVYECGSIQDELDGVLPGSGAVEGNLCFQVPVDQGEGISLFYAPAGSIQGYWSLSADAPPHAALSQGTRISEGRGSRANPLPMGEKGTARDGHAITVVSVDMDADQRKYRTYSHYEPGPAPPGMKYAVARVRIHQEEGIGLLYAPGGSMQGYWFQVPIEEEAIPDDAWHLADWDDYGVITPSGQVFLHQHEWPCPYTRYSIYRNVMLPGTYSEGDLCFVVPEDETGMTLFYRPDDRALGFWTVGEPGSAPPPPTTLPPAVSDSYGSRQAPVPLGETALASNAIAVRVAGKLDHDKILEDSDEYFPGPDYGNKLAVYGVKISNLGDHDPHQPVTVTHSDFALLTSPSGSVTSPMSFYGCAATYNSPVISIHRFPDQLAEAVLFTDTRIETVLCFQIPIGETVQGIIYRDYREDTEEAEAELGFWAVSRDD